MSAFATASAGVRSLSLVRTFVGDGTKVLQVAVKCNHSNKDTRLIKKLVSENKPWCSADLPNICANRKMALAREICALNPKEFEAMIAKQGSEDGGVVELAVAQNVEPAAKKEDLSGVSETQKEGLSELLREQILIEEQRIKIEQKKLDLRVREVALQKELSNLNSSK